MAALVAFFLALLAIFHAKSDLLWIYLSRRDLEDNREVVVSGRVSTVVLF